MTTTPFSLRTLAVGATLLSAASLPLTAAAQAPDKPSREIRVARSVVLVMPRAGLAEKEIDKLLEPHGGRRGQHFRELNVHVVRLPENANVLAVAEALSRNKNVKFAQPDYMRSPGLVTNDPNAADAWHLPKIGASVAWDRSHGDGVTVAVCDSGVDPNHPDIVRVPGYNYYDGNTDSRDVYGHGTKVAGAVAMAGNNGIGGVGVAFRTKIMPIRVTDANGWGYDSAIASCITHAANNGARGANVSFGGVCGSPIIQSAAKYMRDRGGVVTASAGNSGTQEFAQNSDLITCVGATNGSDSRTSWSTYGEMVDVTAPGESIYTTTNGGGYGGVSGTSFSAPVTLGVYALMMAANPNLAPATLDGILHSTAADLGSPGKDVYYGYGRVDAAAAVAKAAGTVAGDSTPPVVAFKSPAAGGKVSGVAAVDVTASDAGGVTKVELYVNGTLHATDTVGPYAYSWDTTNLPDGAAKLSAKAVDAAGNVGSSGEISVTVANDQTPPVAKIENPATGSTVSGTVSVGASATDNTKVSKMTLAIDGREVAVSYSSSISYSWSTGGTTKVRGARKKNQSTTTTPTTSTIVVTAEDPAGNRGTASVTVNRQ